MSTCNAPPPSTCRLAAANSRALAMRWLIDTDVLSERTRKTPNPQILRWLEQNAADCYTSSHVIAEIQSGISSLSDGAKKRSLQQWLNRLIEAMDRANPELQHNSRDSLGTSGGGVRREILSHANAR